MIIEGLFELIYILLEVVFAPINLPDLPAGIESVLIRFFDTILSAIGVFGIFVDMNTVRVLIPIVIVVVNLDKIWTMIMFILRKIPFLGIE